MEKKNNKHKKGLHLGGMDMQSLFTISWKTQGVVYFKFFKSLFNGLIGYQDVIHLNEFISLKSKCYSLNSFLVLRITSRCLNNLYDMLLFYLLNGIICDMLWFNIITATYIFTVSLFTSRQDGPNSFSIYMK